MEARDGGLIFISYSRADSEFALELANELRAAGFPIWFDQLDIPPGCRWDDEVEKALTQCTIFMVILTPSSTASHNVKDEIGYAIDSQKLIMPVLLKNAVAPLRLRRFQYVDFTGKSYDEGIESAKQLLRDLLDADSSRDTAQVVQHNHPPQSLGGKHTEPEHGSKKNSPVKIPMITIGVLGAVVCAIFGFGYLAMTLLLPGPSGTRLPTDAGGPSLTEPDPYLPSPVPSDVEPSALPSSQPTENTNLTINVVPTDPPPPPTEAVPRAFGFQACLSSCNGQNYSSTFPGGIERIHFQYSYENISPGASYTRTWDLEGREWIRYVCSWDGPSTGTEILRFTEPKGFHSGNWTVTIWVNNEKILQESITVAGDWTYWDPAGTIYACRGTN